jgi:molybdopterin-guanine dinucleotide biosynthesis protein A
MYHAPVQDLTAFVLAGGKSSRMGEDKAFLELKGKTLLERALRNLRALTPETMIVGERSRFATFGPVVEDVFRNRGPLGAIHAALTASATEFNLMLAVDLPFIDVAFLRYLVKQAQKAEALVTVPRAQERLQPLCAIFRKGFQQLAGYSLMRGENKIDLLFDTVNTRIIEEAEITREGFFPTIFDNVNTPADFEHAKRR